MKMGLILTGVGDKVWPPCTLATTMETFLYFFMFSICLFIMVLSGKKTMSS